MFEPEKCGGLDIQISNENVKDVGVELVLTAVISQQSSQTC